MAVPEGRRNVRDSSVWYAFCATPQHIPLALFARMPPIVHVAIEAGSGPIFRPKGRRARFAWAPITPGWTRILAPFPSTVRPRKPRAVSTRMPSVMDWPERLVPAERKTSGTPCARETAKRPRTSSALRAWTTASGTSREELASAALAARGESALGKEPVETRVRRPRDPVDRARQDALFPDDRGEGGGEGAWIARRRRAVRRHGGLVRLLPAGGAGPPAEGSYSGADHLSHFPMGKAGMAPVKT